jgi:hypothetical protein
MRSSYRLFLGLAIFYAILAVVYWQLGGEPLGVTALVLSTGFAAIIAFYLWFNDRRLGLLPSDDDGGEISDLAGELGFFSPHSWWPLVVALGACATGLGLLLGWWLTAIALGALFVGVIGFSLEYEKPGAPAEH